MMPEILVLFTTQTTPDSYIQPGGIAFNLTATLIGMLLGGLLACILTVFVQQRLGSILRKIISFGARDRKSSRTMAEMDVRMTYTLRRALRARTSVLRKLITVVLPDGRIIPPLHSIDDDRAKAAADASAVHAEELPIVHAEEGELEAPTAPVKAEEESHEVEAPANIDFDPATATYYIDDMHRRRAEIRFSKRGNDVRLLIPTIIIFVALAATLPVYMPYFVDLLNAAIGKMLGG